MFRCVTELKGLVIDIDSIYSDCSEWEWIKSEYRCVFVSSDQNNILNYKGRFGEEAVLEVGAYEKSFLPNLVLHKSLLEMMKLKTTEIIYVTGNKEFADNAINFLCGTVWITAERITYVNASIAPDLICPSVDNFRELMQNNVKGFLGESIVHPSEVNKQGLVIPVFFEVEGKFAYLYTLGRYFGYSHYMNQLHPYSSAIYLNKCEGKSYYGVFNDVFADLYSLTINAIKANAQVDAVCAVPVRPGDKERFATILEQIRQKCGGSRYQFKFYLH